MEIIVSSLMLERKFKVGFHFFLINDSCCLILETTVGLEMKQGVVRPSTSPGGYNSNLVKRWLHITGCQVKVKIHCFLIGLG